MSNAQSTETAKPPRKSLVYCETRDGFVIWRDFESRRGTGRIAATQQGWRVTPLPGRELRCFDWFSSLADARAAIARATGAQS